MYYTRIIYNANNWICPSGAEGKSTGQSFEARSHFGFDEWLFDFDKLIEGYHYGFLQGLRFGQPNNMPIKLYTIHRINNNGLQPRYWVGTINKWEFINIQDSNVIEQQYYQNGWIMQMRNQVINVNAIVNEFDLVYSDLSKALFNVRFKPSYVQIFNPRIFVVEQEVNDKKRYQLHQE